MPRWNGVVDCQALAVEPNRRLSYSWNASGDEAANSLKTVVIWTLTPTKGGVLLRMEQSGFRPEEESNCRGANYGWQRYVANLERVAAGLNWRRSPATAHPRRAPSWGNGRDPLMR